MCKIGDIIIIYDYMSNGVHLKTHSFVVLSDEAGQIQSLDYDLMCNVMSSFKGEEHKKKKLKFKENFPVKFGDSEITEICGNDKDGYIKAEQLYYFKKEKLDYKVIGKMDPDVFNALVEFIDSIGTLQHITDNL